MSTPHSTTASSTESTIINPFKNYNYELSDGRFESNPGIPPVTNTSIRTANIKRYSRAELHDFRNNTTSRSRPEPSLRAELQSLGVWKFNSSGCNQNGGEGAAPGNSGHSSAATIPLSTNHLIGRSQRSPSTRDPTITATSSSSASHNVTHHSIQKSYIDHRSISSSHLMPAFAKRRIAATSAATTILASQNLAGSGTSTYGGNSPIDAHSQSPTDKDCPLYISTNMRQRTKEHFYDYRQRGGNIGGEEQSSCLSPPKKNPVDHDRDRDRDREHEHSIGRRLSSPVVLGNTRHSHLNSSSTHERRIGSGRLLPRDVNWDYRAGHDKEKPQSINPASAVEKDTVNSHVLPSRSSNRFSERLHERSGGIGNAGYIERRSFERRTCGSVEDKYDHTNNSSSGSSHGSTRRDVYTSESSYHHATSHSRNRRGHQYNDRSEEPEWFSGGPTSQHDTIELRGFEEMDEHYAHNSGNCSSISKRSTLSTLGRKLSESSSSRTSSTLNLSNSKSVEQLLILKESERDRDSNSTTSPVAPNVSNDLVSDVELCAEPNKAVVQTNMNGDNKDSNNYTEHLSRGTEKHLDDSALQNILQEKHEISSDKTLTKTPSKEAEFNFDAFLNPSLDPLKHSLMRGDSLIGSDNENISSSRFSRWFGNKSNTYDMKSAISGNSNACDSKITEDTPDKDFHEPPSKTITLMEFLQLSKLSTICDTGLPQKSLIPSVEELEARMRNVDVSNECSNDSVAISSTVSKVIESESSLGPDGHSDNQSPLTQPQAREIEAFKKLLDQLGSGSKQQHHNLQLQQPLLTNSNIPMSILLQQQTNHTASMPPMNIVITPHLPQPISSQVLLKNDEIKKIMHQQMLNQQQHHPKQLQTPLPPSHSMNQHLPPMSPNVLQNNDPNSISSPQNQGMNLAVLFVGHPQKRIEAQHLFQCLTRGEVSRNVLEQEINNPNTSPHAREVIAAVLRESIRSVTPSTNLNANVVPPQSLGNAGVVGLQHQQLSSPTPAGSGNNISSGPPQTQGPHNSTSTIPQQLLQQLPNPNVILPVQTEQRMPLLQAVPNHHQGLPSQRNLQFHTQTIMQNAMLKKKMEDQQQQESLRRRQEMQKQQLHTNIIIPGLNEIDVQQKSLQQHIQQPSQLTSQQAHVPHNVQQQTQHLNSPTPLAFTPTSVLRKMTAEKENSNTGVSHLQQNSLMQQQPSKQIGHAYINTQSTQQIIQQQPSISTQPRMILGGNHIQQQQVNNGAQITGISQQQQSVQQMRTTVLPMKWPVHFMNQNLNTNKPMGRPILKGPLPTVQPSNQPQQSMPAMQQQLSQITFTSKFDFQQMQHQQRLKNNQTPQHMINQSAQPFPTHTLSQQQPPQQSPQTQTHNLITQQQQQLFQQHQQRSMALQRQHQQMQMHQQQQTLDVANRNIGMQPQSSVNDSNAVSNNNSAVVTTGVGIMNYQRDGRLSPTSNQLAQWFSPELLAQASAGKLPLLNMNQALSLEEFERNIQHSSAAVHN